ncbi:MAG: NAD-glutamate dehydrogenase, partial [Alphaproteobacteria bacterium]|nr:NAD-glutamate dehydrogenase [Alphaproteobacteria bacterium]
PQALARRIAMLDAVACGPDIVRIAGATRRDVAAVGRIYYAVGQRFGFGWLRASAEAIVAETNWQELALAAVIDDLAELQRTITAKVVAVAGDGAPADKAIAAWVGADGRAARRVDALIAELRAAGAVDLSMVTVAGREMRALAGF